MESFKKVYKNGNIRYKNKKGQYHREDGPALEYFDGHVEYWINGQIHREDGPAVEYTNGYKAWYINGERHREDGPAAEWPNGDIWYYLNGNRYFKDSYDKEILKIKLKRIKNL